MPKEKMGLIDLNRVKRILDKDEELRTNLFAPVR